MADAHKSGGDNDKIEHKAILLYLKDAKINLRYHSLKALIDSIDFLERGFVELLKCNDEVTNSESRELMKTNLSGMEHKVWSAMEKLINTFESLKTGSKSFDVAKEQFQKAREKATEAFSSIGSKLCDRIFAVTIMVVAQILESFYYPEKADDLCLFYVKRLHEMNDVREIFSAHINGGFRSKFTKFRRIENIKSVMSLNCKLYQFIVKIRGNHYHTDNWPTIQLRQGKVFNPIFHKIFTTTSSDKELTFHKNSKFSVNRDGDFVLCSSHKDTKTNAETAIANSFYKQREKAVKVSLDEPVSVSVNEERSIHVPMSVPPSLDYSFC
ncbi:uncharacterized protein LOC124451465 [Xenia sp. Carnegie-2017]|uniref:uncharacterized protein LOC124451465 n=1 Tax=Xenia sp. Carnegie-2017 TaxID=2897299 RepID=UPI001F039C2A|nr:uncharacterized protein LOC124451465 [Xenia sp. Carnegie-2017]